MASKAANKQKCPKCGTETDTKEIAKDIDSVCIIAEKMDYGEPDQRCLKFGKDLQIQEQL